MTGQTAVRSLMFRRMMLRRIEFPGPACIELRLCCQDYKATTHVVVEVYYGDGWQLFDPTYGVEFRDSRGEVASYREIRLNPALIVNTAFDRTNKSDVMA